MRAPLAHVLEICERASLARVRLLLPFAPTPGEISDLQARSWIAAVEALGIREDGLGFSGAVGLYRGDPGSGRPTLVFAGHCGELPVSVLAAQYRSGAAQLIAIDRGRIAVLSVKRELARRFKEIVAARVRAHGDEGPMSVIVRGLRSVGALRRLWRSLATEGNDEDETVFRNLVGEAVQAGARLEIVPGRVMFANAGLAAGGAERQIVNALGGLKRAGVTDLHFVGQRMAGTPGLDFFADRLRADAVAIHPLEPVIETARHGTGALGGKFGPLLARIPPALADDVMNFCLLLRKLRPAVLHAWQDPTCIPAGLAALIVGVPRIVLSCRNVEPSWSEYFLPCMRPAWRALAGRADIVILNNSEAGRQSYADWLGVPGDRMQVVRNILAPSVAYPGRLRALDARDKLGVPATAPLIGGMFRFRAEKRPLLWLDVAHAIARRRPDAHYAVFGAGPLRAAARRHARALGLDARLSILDPVEDIAPYLAAMDVLLLVSSHEGLPNVALEAQAVGVATVVTPAGGAAEAEVNPRLFHVAASDEAGAIADTVLRALAARPPEGESAVAVPDRFSERRIVEELLSIYGLAPRGA